MFKNILALLTNSNDAPKELPPADVKHAFGALLVRVAKADHAYLFQEIEQIDKLLTELYDLNPIEAAKLRAECEKLDESTITTQQLGTIIQENVSQAEIDNFVRGLWKVMIADGQKHQTEIDVISVTTQTIGMSPENAETLRREVLGE